MKNIILILLLLFVSLSTSGQEFTYKLKVKKSKKIENLDKNKKAKLDKILVKYKHIENKLIPCYPNAKNRDLLNYYSYKGNGNKVQFKNELDGLEIFESIEQEQMFSIDCSNPEPPVNDTWIANNWANNYALEMIEANCAWSITKGSSEIQIGIADTEFQLTHEDLTNQIIVVYGSPSGGHTHGTMVAGCAAAETNNNKGIAGIGYRSKIVANRVNHTNSNGVAYGNPRSAIWNLYQEGVDIINVSWTGTGLDYAAAQEITQSGITLCLAAGNSPNSNNHSTIANIPGVILVSSVNSNNEHGPKGHAHNQYVDICAPGTNVTTTMAEYPYYGGAWGTSFASPIVAGTIALMLSLNPDLTPEQIENILKSTTDPIDDGLQYIGLLGAGRLNAYKAVSYVHCNYANGYPGTPITNPSGYPTYEMQLGAFKNIRISSSSGASSATGHWWLNGSSLRIVSPSNGSNITVEAINTGYTNFYVTTSNTCGTSPVGGGLIRVTQNGGGGLPMPLSISPNPGKSHIILDFTPKIEDETSVLDKEKAIFEISIYSKTMELIYYNKTRETKLTLNTSDLKEGFYYVHLIKGEDVVRKQFVIKHD